jgi:hypothetical protein
MICKVKNGIILTVALNAGRGAIGMTGGRVAAGGGGGGAAAGADCSSGHASSGALPLMTVRPYTEAADTGGLAEPKVGRWVDGGGGGFPAATLELVAGVGPFRREEMSTFPTGV